MYILFWEFSLYGYMSIARASPERSFSHVETNTTINCVYFFNILYIFCKYFVYILYIVFPYFNFLGSERPLLRIILPVRPNVRTTVITVSSLSALCIILKSLPRSMGLYKTLVPIDVHNNAYITCLTSLTIYNVLKSAISQHNIWKHSIAHTAYQLIFAWIL